MAALQRSYFRRFFDLPEMPRQSPRMSAGAGVIVDAGQGYVITNHHVSKGALQMSAAVNGGYDVPT
jgi:serine protease DegQ